MHFILIGLNYRHAPVELRERIAFGQNDLKPALSQITNAYPNVSEVTILSTCNRVEIYACVDSVEDGFVYLKRFICEFHEIPEKDFLDYLYLLQDFQVVEHLFAVTSGLDSMIPGEPQIQGQVKAAIETALEQKSAHGYLSHLFQSALATGKRVRSETRLSAHSLSLSHVAGDAITSFFPEPQNVRIVIVGAGKMSQIAFNHLRKSGVSDITVLNRSVRHAEQAFDASSVQTYSLEHLERVLAEADAVISSTGAQSTIISFSTLRAILNNRQGRKMLLIDLAVPRDIEERVSDLPGVRLLNVDDLNEIIAQNHQRRTEEMAHARKIVGQEVERFQGWYNSLKIKPVIQTLRNKAEEIREHELQRALRRFERELSDAERLLVQELTRRIVNKILHHPFVKLREEASCGNGEQLSKTVEALFCLKN